MQACIHGTRKQMIYIDFREKDLLEVAKCRGLMDTTIRPENAMINGDIHIGKEPQQPFILLERKKIADFKASISDNRWSEQRHRLQLVQESNPTTKVGYLFEACDKSDGVYFISKEDKRSVEGAVQNLQIEFNMLAFVTYGPEETMDVLMQMNAKLNQYTAGRSIDVSYVSHTKRSEKSKNGYRTLLCTVEGISSTKAEAIKEKYPTFKELWKTWESSQDPSMLLANIEIPKQKAKLGKVLSQRICERYFH